MFEKYTLDGLTQDVVSVNKQNYIAHQGQIYPVGDLWRRAYLNDTYGRQQIVNELPEAQTNAILAVWGEEPTIIDFNL